MLLLLREPHPYAAFQGTKEAHFPIEQTQSEHGKENNKKDTGQNAKLNGF
jgi:hypothetical protein